MLNLPCPSFYKRGRLVGSLSFERSLVQDPGILFNQHREPSPVLIKTENRPRPSGLLFVLLQVPAVIDRQSAEQGKGRADYVAAVCNFMVSGVLPGDRMPPAAAAILVDNMNGNEQWN